MFFLLEVTCLSLSLLFLSRVSCCIGSRGSSTPKIKENQQFIGKDWLVSIVICVRCARCVCVCSGIS